MALPLGELARERLRGFSPLKGSRKLSRSAALSQKAALQLPFPVTTLPVKMEQRSVRRRSAVPKFKIIFPLIMRIATRSAFKIVPRKKQPPHQKCSGCFAYVIGYQPFRKAGRGLPSLSHW